MTDLMHTRVSVAAADVFSYDERVPPYGREGGKRPLLKAVDLYAGAGGLSLGLHMAGIDVAAAVESDKWAALSYSKNFPFTQLIQGRVTDLADEFFESFQGVDLVTGGPPCQGFSISAGRRRSENDERNSEVFHFLDAALRLRPKFILLENVPAILNFRLADGTTLVDRLKYMMAQAGYNAQSFIIDAAEYGVPQHRKRFFLIASTGAIPDLHGCRTHSADAGWIGALDAISDLPPVVPGQIGEEDCLSYACDPQNEYQSRLRAPEGFFWNHVPMRHSPRLIERFAAIPEGGNGATVWTEHPARQRGKRDGSGVQFEQNHRRMSATSPAPTITAYMYSTCLHPRQHRNLTVREAARLQGFPDNFRFWGKRTTLSAKLLQRKGLHEDLGLNQLNQVGNAVPPLVASTIGNAIIGVLRS